MNYILHIDTSGSTGTIAVSADGRVLSKVINEDTRNQAVLINNMVDTALQQAGIKLNELSAVAVCAGPGSYTGLRIGVATAKAFCYILDIPLQLHNKLTLLARQQFEKEKGYDRYAVLLTARDKEYFVAIYDMAFQQIQEPVHILESSINTLFGLNRKLLLVSDQKEDIIKNLIANKLKLSDQVEIDLAVWAQYVANAYKCNESVNLSMAEPFYLKQAYTTK